jgi:carbon storage regulator
LRRTEGEKDMLVLTRRVGEAIVIDGGISIAVLSEKGGQIRLGITAPRWVGVQRQELLVRAQGNGADVAARRASPVCR